LLNTAVRNFEVFTSSFFGSFFDPSSVAGYCGGWIFEILFCTRHFFTASGAREGGGEFLTNRSKFVAGNGIKLPCLSDPAKVDAFQVA
jgi:hypothetical protein